MSSGMIDLWISGVNQRADHKTNRVSHRTTKARVCPICSFFRKRIYSYYIKMQTKRHTFMNSYYTDPHQNPYWQKLNRDPSENSSGQGTFEQDPNWHPQPEYGRQLGRTAALIGVSPSEQQSFSRFSSRSFSAASPSFSQLSQRENRNLSRMVPDRP